MLRRFSFVLALAGLALGPALAKAETITTLPVAPTTGSFNLTANIGGTFKVANTGLQATGTGQIDSFLRIQQNGSEAGFNTGTGAPLQVNSGYNNTLQLSQIPYFTIDGVDYFEFLLDVNQTGANPTISLNQIQIFQSSAPATNSTAGYTPAAADGSTDEIFSQTGLTEVFRMDPSTKGNQIIIHTGSGSGSGDMFLYVQRSLFVQDGSSYITLFSQFGTPPGSQASNDGFEEWAVRRNVGSYVPLPSTLALLASALPVAGWLGIRRRKNGQNA